MLEKIKELYKNHKVEAWGILALILAITGYFVYKKSTGATGATGAAGVSGSTNSASGDGGSGAEPTGAGLPQTSTVGGQVANSGNTADSGNGANTGQSVRKPATPAIPATAVHPVVSAANNNVAATSGVTMLPHQTGGGGQISSDAAGMSKLPAGS
jgi:hypothetical protein